MLDLDGECNTGMAIGYKEGEIEDGVVGVGRRGHQRRCPQLNPSKRRHWRGVLG